MVESDGTVFHGVVFGFQVTSSAYYSVGCGYDEVAERIRVLLRGFPDQGFTYQVKLLILKELAPE